MRIRGRSSGILLHPTSLPGPHGIGDLGSGARDFVHFLHYARQHGWQMLPVVPPGGGNSPYMSSSAFAGSPLLIDLSTLGLPRADLAPLRGPAGRVDYDAVRRFKDERLREAYRRFSRRPDRRLAAFRRRNAAWLDDFTLFSALQSRAGGAPWWEWEAGLRRRDPAALRRARGDLAAEIDHQAFLQFIFDRQWTELRRLCEKLEVALIGDVPIFVSHDSADVWASQELFELDDRGLPVSVAGVPPDYFSSTGQRWGNPLYRWDVLAHRGYDWWVRRLRAAFSRFDAVRLDHFIGFVRTWAIPADEPTAVRGRYRAGPGAAFFRKILSAIPEAAFIAEDLGTVIPEVKELRDHFGFPGMRVLQFAFGNDPEADSYKPHNHPAHCVVYTGTHDNDTTAGWWNDRGGGHSTRTREQIRVERSRAAAYTGTDGRRIHWDMIRLAMTSVAGTSIVPAQDLLGLGSEARFNRPGVPEGNWEWRLAPGALTSRIGAQLRDLTMLTQRDTPRVTPR